MPPLPFSFSTIFCLLRRGMVLPPVMDTGLLDQVREQIGLVSASCFFPAVRPPLPEGRVPCALRVVFVRDRSNPSNRLKTPRTVRRGVNDIVAAVWIQNISYRPLIRLRLFSNPLCESAFENPPSGE
jgi:hypothetical protein